MSAVGTEQPLLQDLLHAEMAAVEAYARIFDSFRCSEVQDTILELQHGHADAVRALGWQIYRLGVKPDPVSGGKSSWAPVLFNLDFLLGTQELLLQALIQCERLTAAQYESAMDQSELDETAREVVKSLYEQRLKLVETLCNSAS